MKTLIIAAGRGKRLAMKRQPKSLLYINEKTIIETILDTCNSVGLDDFVIVTGYEGKKIKEALKKGKNKIKYIENPNFSEKENGYSVYCAKDALKENFLLLMSDHIFDSSILESMLDYKIENGCALCIDKDLENIFDLDEATKVYEQDKKILDIGKEIKLYNAVDTGFFLCTPYIFEVLERSIGSGSTKLSDAMKLLANEKKLFSIDITGNFWTDIDTEEDLEYAKKYLNLQSFIG